MALKTHSSVMYGTELSIIVAEGDTYSNAFQHDAFIFTTIHSPQAEVVVQVSNKGMPDEETDADWHDLGPASKFMRIEGPVHWIRIKCANVPAGGLTAYATSGGRIK